MVRRRRVMRKRPALRRRGRKSVGRAQMKRKSDYARLVETTETQIFAVNDAAGDSVGGVTTFALADFQRAQEVAHAYKYYRAAKVQMTFIPYYNISQVNAPGAAGTRLPQLYFTVDRVANKLIAPTESELLERGVGPKLFNRKRVFTWKPNILQEVNFETNQPGDGGGNPLGINVLGALNSIAVFNKWLPTQQGFGYTAVPPNAQVGQQIVPNGINPYSIQYYGAAWCTAMEQIAPGVPQAVGDLQVKITWEFKDPRALKTNAPTVPPNPYAATSMTTSGVIANSQPTSYP